MSKFGSSFEYKILLNLMQKKRWKEIEESVAEIK